MTANKNEMKRLQTVRCLRHVSFQNKAIRLAAREDFFTAEKIVRAPLVFVEFL